MTTIYLTMIDFNIPGIESRNKGEFFMVTWDDYYTSSCEKLNDILVGSACVLDILNYFQFV